MEVTDLTDNSAVLRVDVELTGNPRELLKAFDMDDVADGKILYHREEQEFAARTADEVLMIANLARPGCIAWHSTSKELRPTPLREYAEHDFLEFTQQIGGWPHYTRIPVSQVAQWLQDGDDWLLFSQFDSDVSRALGCLSYVFLPRPTPFVSRFIFMVMGVEALYKDKTSYKDPKGGKKRDSIPIQLTKRSQGFLGEEPRLQDLIKAMYKTRSELLHGNCWFPSAFDHAHTDTFGAPADFESDGVDGDKNSFKLAIAILMGTIQEMIREGLHSLTFP